MVNVASNIENLNTGKKINTYPTTKRCTGCRQDKPLTEYYPIAKGKPGRESICKACRKKKRRRLYQESATKAKPNQARQHRRPCLRCAKQKWPSTFFPHSRRPDRLTRLCQACHANIAGKKESA